MRALLLASLVVIGCHRAPPKEQAPIGAACTSDGACGTSPTFYCASDHPGGYCEAGCNSDRDCPSAAVCVGGTTLSKGDCHQRCQTAANCRRGDGYQCIAGGTDASSDYCDPPGRSELARRMRGKAWRW
jgi:hypothetical protein